MRTSCCGPRRLWRATASFSASEAAVREHPKEAAEHDEGRVQHVDRIAQRDAQILCLAFDIGPVLPDLGFQAACPPAMAGARTADVGVAELACVARRTF